MLFSWIRRKLAASKPAADALAFEALEVLAPREEQLPDEASAPASAPLICREAILDRTQKIAGYQFRLRHSVVERIRCSSHQVRRLYDRVLLDHLLTLKLERLLGGRFALIELDMASLQEDALEQLPLRQLIIAVNPEQAPSLQDLQRLQHLRSRGARIAWSHADALHVSWSGLLPLIDLFILSIAGQGAQALAMLGALFSRCPEVQILARGLEAYDHFDACHRWQFQDLYVHYFQGEFITRREAWTQPDLEPGRLTIMQVLNQLRRGADLRTLAQNLRQDSVLVFKLLRYVNSPAGGLSTPVSSIEHAVVVLGREKLARWLGVLLFSATSSNARDLTLLDTALIRARLLELLLISRMSRVEQEQAFIAGLFSLLDRLLRMPMADLIQQLQLPEPVAQALLDDAGWLAPWLRLVLALEQERDDVQELAAALGVGCDELNQKQIEAMVWAQEAQS